MGGITQHNKACHKQMSVHDMTHHMTRPTARHESEHSMDHSMTCGTYACCQQGSAGFDEWLARAETVKLWKCPTDSARPCMQCESGEGKLCRVVSLSSQVQ